MKKIIFLSVLLMIGHSVSGAKKTETDSKAPALESDSVATMSSVEVLPLFRGKSADTFKWWVAGNMSYPAQIMEKYRYGTGELFEGRITIRFIVEKNGSLSNLEISDSPNPAFDKEIRRVILKSPRWKPAYVNSLPVRVWYTMPIDFVLSKDTRKTLDAERQAIRLKSITNPKSK